MIYGVALLAFCMLTGSFIGHILGHIMGLGTDVGGVGFAMVLLLLITNSKKLSQKLPKGSEEGLSFWKKMFIPIVVAMSASQNVYHAISGGAVAIIAGLAAVFASFALLYLLNLLTNKKNENQAEEGDESCRI